MKKILLIWLLTWVTLAVSAQAADTIRVKSVLDVLQNKKQKLLKKIFANQDTVKNLIKEKPKEIVLGKKKIPVKAMIPLYIPDSIPNDVEAPIQLHPTPIMVIIVPEIKLEKKTFFQRVFGRKRQTYVIIINKSITKM